MEKGLTTLSCVAASTSMLLSDNYKSTPIGTLLEGRQNYDGQTMKMLKEVCSSLPTPRS